MLEEQFLYPARHDRQAFTSGVDELDVYLQRFAAQQSKKGVAVVRVLVDVAVPSTILGYYSLSAAQIGADQLDPRTQQKLPRYPPPSPVSAWGDWQRMQNTGGRVSGDFLSVVRLIGVWRRANRLAPMPW